VHGLAMWLTETSISHFMVNSPWAWPLCETLHFMGLSLLIGVVGLFDLRLLGVAPAVPIGPLSRLMPWAIGGFLVNLLTGLLFFIGSPLQYIDNVAFWMKMLFVLLAGINVAVFSLSSMRNVAMLKPGEPTPLSVKVVAAASLVCWFSVMYWGRMLPYLGDAF
jgi:Family of unknown function (DUF6644)